MDHVTRKRLRSAAKTVVLSWFDQTDGSPTQRKALSRGLDRFLVEIGRRDDWSESMTVVIGGSAAPAIHARTSRARTVPCSEGLIVSSVVPGWGFGWTSILDDEDVYDVLSWFGHYARQYVHRSEVARILMIAWERDGVVLHPFGHRFDVRRYGPVLPTLAPKQSLTLAIERMLCATLSPSPVGASVRSKWLQRNTLDPSVHEAIFHFLRAQSLLAGEFEIEAMVAFDCMTQALMRLWAGRAGARPKSRRDFCLALGLSQRSADLAEHLYFLRNQFGAHAGGWRWWDVGEEMEEIADRATALALRILRRAADQEPGVRRVDPYPLVWSDWLLDNFAMVWAATWFK